MEEGGGMRVHLRVEGPREAVWSFASEFLQAPSIQADRTYRPVEGVEVRCEPLMVQNKAWPSDPAFVMEFVAHMSGPAVGTFSFHLGKAAFHRIRIRLNGRKVESQEDALEVLRQAYNDQENPEETEE